MKSWISEHSGYLAWAVALVSMLGSLYFSEIKNYAPCILCWYQRIAMYPLVAIIGVGILRRDRSMWTYALPLSIIGAGIALYHNLLQWKIIPEQLAPCTQGISCVTRNVIALNFVTIPLLSLAAFSLITVLMFIRRADTRNA
jgi:disulfide bond formation protein DsbB